MNKDEILQPRPAFHITGGRGWINDPNGLVFFKNRYHVFFQYYPYGVKWGPMHWGHTVSDDLTNWESLPVALAPESECDRDGCFSGSAIVWKDRLWLMYTGYTENGGGDSVRQVQCLAVSRDGVNFVKRGVVIGTDDLPADYAPCDFRDPKVWMRGDKFYCVVAARKVGGRGRILLYRSDDLHSWEFVSDIFGEDSKGSMTECPDYREDMGLLTVCEQYPPREGSAHLNIHTSRWYTGRLDYETGRFSAVNSGICDYGFDFYAPQTFCDVPVMLGWLNMWDRNVPSERYGFSGMLTVPRKMEVRGGALWQEPAVKLKEVCRREFSDSLSDRIKVGAVRIKAKGLEQLCVLMRKKGGSYAELRLCGGEWVFDRSRAGESISGEEKDEDSANGVRRMPCAAGGGNEIMIVLDEFSAEIFADGRALSATMYPEPDADGLEIRIRAKESLYIRYAIDCRKDM